jgi:hypothetical protein
MHRDDGPAWDDRERDDDSRERDAREPGEDA